MNRPSAPAVGPAALARAVRLQDHLRLPRRGVGHKEWLHFCLSTDELDVLVNFSFVDAGGDPERTWTARTTLLARTDGWAGEVVTVPADRVDASPGGTRLRLGPSACALDDDGAFRVTARGERSGVEADLLLEPEVLPALVHNVQLGDTPPLHWLIAPRWRARGSLRVAGRRHDLRGALAYHDHNWGRFAWGGDFAWEWGYALDPAPDGWTVVFVRMSDRARTGIRRQGVFLWRHGLQRRVFRGADVDFETHGLLRRRPGLALPPILGLLRPHGATDVPERLVARAGAPHGDHATVTFRPDAVAQLLVPHDGPTGLTTIHEASGEVEVVGRVGDEDVAFRARTMVEFLRG